jgi:hypothetical protein
MTQRQVVDFEGTLVPQSHCSDAASHTDLSVSMSAKEGVVGLVHHRVVHDLLARARHCISYLVNPEVGIAVGVLAH